MLQRLKMKLKGVDHITITVSDIEKSLEYYRKLGFEVEFVDKEEGIVRIYHLKLGNVRIDLKRRGSPKERVGVNHIAFSVDDTDETYKNLTGKGIKFSLKPYFNASLGRLVANFEPDPDGVLFQITSHKKGLKDPKPIL